MLYKSKGIKKKRVQKLKYKSKKWTNEATLIKYRSMLEDLITYENKGYHIYQIDETIFYP